MATYTNFEDLEIWKRSRVLCNKIFEIASQGSFKNDFELKNQIRRSSGSIMDNIAEGFERDGNKEFVQFLYYSKGSAGEVRSQLHRALDYKHIENDVFNALRQECIEIAKMIDGLISYLKNLI